VGVWILRAKILPTPQTTTQRRIQDRCKGYIRDKDKRREEKKGVIE
jgi:hypothetical protein